MNQETTTNPDGPCCPWCGAQPTTITISDPLRCPACGRVIVRKAGQLLKGEEPVAVPAAPPKPPPPAASPAAPAVPGVKTVLKLETPGMLKMPGEKLRLIDLDAAEVILANIYFQQNKIIALLERQVANQQAAMGLMAPEKAKNGTADERG